MGERTISKGFTVEAWNYGAINADVPRIFMQNFVHVDVTAVGPGLQGDGLLAGLATLERIGTWLKSQWQGRVIIGSTDNLLVQRCKRIDWPRRPVILPEGDSMPELARYLLIDVCEPLLRGSGIVVRKVAVRRGAEEPQSAELLDEDVEAYFAEPTDDGLETAPVNVANSEAALHTSKRPKFYTGGDDPARPYHRGA